MKAREMARGLAAAGLLLCGPAWADAQFEARITERATQLTIPGIAYAVIRDGKVTERSQVKSGEAAALTTSTPLRFASVTKAFTAVLLMRAVETGKLSLDDSVSKWLPDFRDRPEIKVRHLAAHVSEGIPGTEYVYGTQRYAKLGEILRQAYRADSFEAALRREVIEPAGLAWHDSPELGAHAALVSTVDEVAKFAAALQTNRLLSKKSFELMTRPFESPAGQELPVGVGFFSQVIGGERVVWSFGQDDPDYGSALLLMLPKRRLALVMLANTDELSNPFRLVMGNVRTSPFATAFLDVYAPDIARDIAPRDRQVTEILAALASDQVPRAIQAFTTLAAGDARVSADDFALHFVAGVLAAQLPKDYCAKLDTAVTDAHARNRWALLMSGGINTQLGQREIALRRYEALLALPNQEPDGLWRLFQAWAYTGSAAAVKDVDPKRAHAYIEAGLATGVTGGTREGLLQMQKAIAQPTASPAGN
jgi:CubicO group peptidase (beta-lactamase class C family)